MKIATMRRIDRQAGVPFCAAATVFSRLLAWLRPKAVRPQRRILFIELSEMGSTVLAEPAMRKARERLNAELFFVVFARNAGSVELLGTFPRDHVYTISDESWLPLTRAPLAFLGWPRRMAMAR